jgi:hypothetical protein
MTLNKENPSKGSRRRAVILGASEAISQNKKEIAGTRHAVSPLIGRLWELPVKKV